METITAEHPASTAHGTDADPCTVGEIPTRRHIQPVEVRLPATRDEARAALDVCDANVRSLENFIAYASANGFECSSAQSRLLKWEQRIAEIRYIVARMDAGLPTVDPTLPDRYSSTLAQLVDARTRIAELEKRVGETPRAGLLAELEKQKAARAGDLTKVKHTLRQMHEINARVTYALRGLASIGLLTPTAAQVLHTCSRAMPPGFFDTWATEHHGAFVEAALTQKARNGATLEEPAGERRDALDVVMEQQAEAS